MKRLMVVVLMVCASAWGEGADQELEAVELATQEVERDLALLEEELLYPPSSRVAVYLSMDVGALFALDAVKVLINGREVAHHLYTERQVAALHRGALQELYVGNVATGGNELSAFFIGTGPSGRAFKRAAHIEFEKSFDPLFVELVISDDEGKRQPEFEARVQ